MNLREYEVLDGLNIASTIHMAERDAYKATAAQIAEVMRDDPRMGYAWATARNVGAILRGLSREWPFRRAPLVEKVDTRNWRLTAAGVRVLSA